MIKRIREVAEAEQYYTKITTNSVIKLNCTTPDTYRNLIKLFKENEIFYQAYQLKEERAYRIVLKYLHHSTDVEDICEELFDLGHANRNIVNVQHRITNEPLNLFFVDLEPAVNNKDKYNITALQNKIIQIETPRVKKKNIPQCARSQQCGHTRKYCNKPFACVKCGESHNSKNCSKRKDTPAKCALCGGNHPANYKGCEHYHNIMKGNNIYRTPQIRTSPILTTTSVPTTTLHNLPKQQRIYAEVTNNHAHQDNDLTSALNTFLEDFKGLFAQLLQQNILILNMLTTLLNKPH
jgi:hypothetical protein